MAKVALYPIQSSTLEINKVETLYMSAFPECERRDLSEWTALLSNNNNPFTIYVIKTEDFFAGFISCWNFRQFVYVEHFAIDPKMRGNGVGGQAIQALAKTYNNIPLILEVEPPTYEMAIRRIHFYERQGFNVNNAYYLQPPYRRGDKWLELKLMSTNPQFLEKNIEKVKQEIYRNVYFVID